MNDATSTVPELRQWVEEMAERGWVFPWAETDDVFNWLAGLDYWRCERLPNGQLMFYFDSTRAVEFKLRFG